MFSFHKTINTFNEQILNHIGRFLLVSRNFYQMYFCSIHVKHDPKELLIQIEWNYASSQISWVHMSALGVCTAHRIQYTLQFSGFWKQSTGFLIWLRVHPGLLGLPHTHWEIQKTAITFLPLAKSGWNWHNTSSVDEIAKLCQKHLFPLTFDTWCV